MDSIKFRILSNYFFVSYWTSLGHTNLKETLAMTQMQGCNDNGQISGAQGYLYFLPRGLLLNDLSVLTGNLSRNYNDYKC